MLCVWHQQGMTVGAYLAYLAYFPDRAYQPDLLRLTRRSHTESESSCRVRTNLVRPIRRAPRERGEKPKARLEQSKRAFVFG